jgi:hypothetical protein
MREPSEICLAVNANIKQARGDLIAMSRQAASWRALNEVAAKHLKAASTLKILRLTVVKGA